jgi:hypothetical protein
MVAICKIAGIRCHLGTNRVYSHVEEGAFRQSIFSMRGPQGLGSDLRLLIYCLPVSSRLLTQLSLFLVLLGCVLGCSLQVHARHLDSHARGRGAAAGGQLRVPAD